MKALLVEDGVVSYRQDYPRPEPAADEALIRVLLAGICATDLEIVEGYAGYRGILGHEFVGEVVSIDDDNAEAWLGRRVVGTINLGCGACPVCVGEGPEHCPNRRVLGIREKDGVFAEYTTLPVANLRPVPDSVKNEQAVFVEPLAAAVRIREQVKVRPTARVAVLGPGRLGLLCGQVLSVAGTEVIMLGRRPASMELPAAMGLATGLAGEQPEKQFDIVVDSTGNESGLVEALRLVRPQGMVVLKSTFSGRAQIDLSPLVVNEVTVVGSRCGPFAPALRLLASGEVKVSPLIDARYSLAKAKAALAHAARPGVRKVLFEIGG